MPRVLCFGRFCDEIPGGMQRHVEHLFTALSGKVDYVHLVPSRDRHAASFKLHGVPVIRTPSLNVDGSVALSPGLVSAARRLNREKRFDLIHLHFPDPMSHLAAMALPADIPRIISWHADVIRHRGLLHFYRPLLRKAIRTAAAIIVATPAHVSSSPELSQIADPARIHVIPYGFDLSRYLAPAPQAAEIRARFPGKIIFALGRHVYYKGFDVLIRAMANLGNDTHLIIGGTGPLTSEWRALAEREGLAGRVHFPGLINEDDLPAYYQASTLFCLPAVSTAEAFGIVQVEAMACGKAVVSTRLGNGVDFVNVDGQTGFTVTPRDVGALTNALVRILDDDGLRARLEVNARRRAIEEFSLEAMGEKMLTVYRSCLQHAG